MTENEIIGMLEIEKSYMDSHAGRSQSEALAYAIEAVKEIQRYRAIGTVEGYEKAIQATTEYYLLMKEYKSKVQDFEAIGTVEEFKALKEKNEPKKPYLNRKGLLDVKMWHCPVCKKEVASDWNRDLANDYCHNCGQKLD